MATADQLPKAPPLRFELTEEQVADLERSKPPGSVALVVGYAERHLWPDPERFTLCAWFVAMPEAEAVLSRLSDAGSATKVSHAREHCSRHHPLASQFCLSFSARALSVSA
jgi:hypothetical protein